MSPGRPSRAAELGGDPHHLAATIHLALDKAHAAERSGLANAARAMEAYAATAQAAAIALLAANVGRLVDALEADIASTSTLRFPAPPTLVQS